MKATKKIKHAMHQENYSGVTTSVDEAVIFINPAFQMFADLIRESSQHVAEVSHAFGEDVSNDVIEDMRLRALAFVGDVIGTYAELAADQTVTQEEVETVYEGLREILDQLKASFDEKYGEKVVEIIPVDGEEIADFLSFPH